MVSLDLWPLTKISVLIVIQEITRFVLLKSLLGVMVLATGLNCYATQLFFDFFKNLTQFISVWFQGPGLTLKTTIYCVVTLTMWLLLITGYVILTHLYKKPSVIYLVHLQSIFKCFTPEPNHFPDVANFTVSPEQNSKDFETLKTLLKEKSLKTQYVVGPDTAVISPTDYFQRYPLNIPYSAHMPIITLLCRMHHTLLNVSLLGHVSKIVSILSVN